MKLPDDFQENILLSAHCTFGIGGPTRYFAEVSQPADMQTLISFCHNNNLPYLVLGKGSNCLFDDRGFDGLVILNRINFIEQPESGLFHVGAGYSFSLLGSKTARQGWSGLEFAAGIPGSVGGAVFMNAGANGKETCESLVSVDFIEENGTLVKIEAADLVFGYRHSPFHHLKGAISGATFRLIPSEKARESQLAIVHYRKKTQPYGSKSAGCIFRNPQADRTAGALIDQSGLKGISIGGAEVSLMHANFLVNTGTATAQDVLSLISLIREEVKTKMGYELESEVRYIPYSITTTDIKL